MAVTDVAAPPSAVPAREPARLTPAQISYLDLLRGLAAVVVLIGHAGHAFMQGSWLSASVLEVFGVVAFFLISGFLITSSVLARLADPGYGFRTYLIDRFFRIFTPYVPALIAVAAVDATIVTLPDYPYARDYNVATWIGNLFMLQDYPVFQVLRRLGVSERWWFFAPFGSARPFWTIMIEWWIYLLFGWIVFIALARRLPAMLTLTVAAVLAVVPGYHFVAGYAQCLTMVWLLGAAGSYFWHTQPERLLRHPALARNAMRIGAATAAFGFLCLGARMLASRNALYELQYEVYLAIGLFGIFVMLGEARRPVPKPVAAVLAFVAAFSYSLYLTHYTVIVFVAAWFPGRGNDPALFWSVIAGSILVAVAFWGAFERYHRVLADIARRRLGAYARAASAHAGRTAS